MIGERLARENQFEIARSFSCPTNRHGGWQQAGIHTAWILYSTRDITTLSEPVLNCRERLSNV